MLEFKMHISMCGLRFTINRIGMDRDRYRETNRSIIARYTDSERYTQIDTDVYRDTDI